MIVIIDYGVGNLRSVFNAFDLLGADITISRDPEEIIEADKVVFPGVGAFGKCKSHLEEFGLFDVVNEVALKQKKPFLGICVGMQLMASKGFEEGEWEGMNWIPGKVERFKLKDLPVPHVGWNTISIAKEHPVLKGLDQRDMYFTHSYHFVCDQNEDVLATAEYGGKFTAAIARENIIATQFHPEKSGDSGLKLLENFLDWEI